MTEIPGFPMFPWPEFTLHAWETHDEALQRELRGRRWVWLSSFGRVAQVPDGFVAVHWDPMCDATLYVREPLAPAVTLWCWLCTRGRWWPLRTAFRLGFLELEENQTFDAGRWRWPLVSARFRDYAVRGARAQGRAEGRAESYRDGYRRGVDQGYREGWDAAFARIEAEIAMERNADSFDPIRA